MSVDNNQARVGQDNSWAGHAQATLVLGLPLAGAQLAQSVVSVTDTLMMGWLGVTELAGGVLATQMLFIFWIFGGGFSYAIVPIAASAQGAGDETGVRRAVRMGLWVAVVYFILTIAPMWYAKDIMLALGQEPIVADIVEQYMRIALWAVLPQLLLLCLRSLLSTLELARVILLASICTAVFNALFNYMFMFGNFGAPELGVRGAAVATLLTHSLMLVFVALYVYRNVITAKYQIFTRIWRFDREAFSEIVRLGLPIGTAMLAEVSLFVGASVMMGWISTVALAAHGIVLQLATITFMIPLGLSVAATVRVGKSLGRRDWLGLERAGLTVLAIAVGIALLAAIVFWSIPQQLIELFLDAEIKDTAAVVAYAIPLLYVAAAFQLVDSTQAIATGILRGLKDTKIPMYIAVTSYWLLGMPLAYFLGFTMGYGGVGLWFGLAAALSVAAILLTGRFVLRRKFGLIPE